jgi:phosphopantothenoylcysteine decarboxylase / phosphopantothenate---cysteine ligase
MRVSGKIKKENTPDELTIQLKKNKDILLELGRTKKSNQVLVGFALESHDELENGKKKLISKNCDLLVVNSAVKIDSGFEGDYNTITVLNKDGNISSYPAMSKMDCAEVILSHVAQITSD